MWLRLTHKPEQMACHFAHLYLFSALCNAVSSVMAVDMFKGFVARISHAAVHLHCEISRVAAQAVRAVIAHADLVRKPYGDFGFGHRVHLGGSLINQKPQHFSLGRQLD